MQGDEQPFVQRMPFGAQIEEDGRVRFRVWAPEASEILLLIEDREAPLQLHADGKGWHELTTSEAGPGSRYRYILPNGTAAPDPVSRFQPNDVNGPSEVTDPRFFDWQTRNWKGRPWEDAVIYELHVGTFSSAGTFLGVIEKLDHLVSVGVTAIEIMSVGDFPGRWNWGYDGVFLFAPDSSYGTPDDLKRLVDAAHQRNVMVILDVVYNHFGPEGNYLPQFFPDIATDQYMTPWGKALNFDSRHCEQTREFIIQNALYWITEFRMDGLRLDAVHAIVDSSSIHVLDELARRVRSAASDRHVHIILESDDTMWVRLLRDSTYNPLLSTAQWNHDCKYLASLGLTRGRSANEDLRDTELLGHALIEGFTSQPPKNLASRIATEHPEHLPPLSFISFLQTHDLVGNRIGGERISHFASGPVLRALAAIYLLAPQIPMLFMGEEWAASTPFPFFCDFSGDLADAVRRGRLEQFTTPQQRQDAAFVSSIPDPLAEQTFQSAKLKWDETTQHEHASMLAFYREIMAVRRRRIVPMLRNFPENAGVYQVHAPRFFEVHWELDTGTLRLEANLSHEAVGCSCDAGETLWLEGALSENNQLAPWSVRWSLSVCKGS